MSPRALDNHTTLARRLSLYELVSSRQLLSLCEKKTVLLWALWALDSCSQPLRLYVQYEFSLRALWDSQCFGAVLSSGSPSVPAGTYQKQTNSFFANNSFPLSFLSENVNARTCKLLLSKNASTETQQMLCVIVWTSIDDVWWNFPRISSTDHLKN